MKTRYRGAYGGRFIAAASFNESCRKKRAAIVKVSADTFLLSTTLFSNFLPYPTTFDANEPCAFKVEL